MQMLWNNRKAATFETLIFWSWNLREAIPSVCTTKKTWVGWSNQACSNWKNKTKKKERERDEKFTFSILRSRWIVNEERRSTYSVSFSNFKKISNSSVFIGESGSCFRMLHKSRMFSRRVSIVISLKHVTNTTTVTEKLSLKSSVPFTLYTISNICESKKLFNATNENTA